MRHTNDPGGLYRVLALVFAALLAVMFLFEFTKQLLIPGVSLWQSHGITIVFTSILAVVLVSFPLRSAYREQVKAREELRLRQTAEAHLRRSELAVTVPLWNLSKTRFIRSTARPGTS